MRVFLTDAVSLLTRFRLCDVSQLRPTALTPLGCVVVELVLGLAAACVGWALHSLCAPLPAALLSAVLISSAWWWIHGAEGLKCLISALESGSRSSSGSQASTYIRLSMFQGFVIAKAACVGYLAASGHSLWFVAAAALGGASFGQWLRPATSSDEEAPPLPIAHGHWILALVAASIVGGCYGRFFSGLLCAGVIWLLMPFLRRLASLGLAPMQCAQLGQELTEAGVLLLGLLLLANR